MSFPFRIIESKISNRNEFDVTDGFQPTYALFYLKKGTFRIEFDGEPQTVGPGECLILPDYLRFRRNVITPIEFLYIKFADNPDCPYSLHIPYGKVSFDDKERFASDIAAIEQLLTRDDALATSYREHLLKDLLFQLARRDQRFTAPTEQRTVQDPLVARAVAYIRQNLAAKLSIEEVCRAVGTNSSTLNFHFRRELDMSIGQAIINERMEKARSLFTGTTYSVSEVAARCGFENVYYFSNVFKKRHGMSPSKYRNAHNEFVADRLSQKQLGTHAQNKG